MAFPLSRRRRGRGRTRSRVARRSRRRLARPSRRRLARFSRRRLPRKGRRRSRRRGGHTRSHLSRRRRVSGRSVRYTGQSSTHSFLLKNEMAPYDVTGIIPANIGLWPSFGDPANVGLISTNIQAEQIVPAAGGERVAAYSFDFTSMVSQNLGNSASIWDEIKLSTASMTIRRVDTGAAWGVLQSPGQPPFPTNFGIKSARMHVDYYWVPDGSLSTGDFTRTFIGTGVSGFFDTDPGVRRRVLMPGRKISFKFKPSAHGLRHMTIQTRYNRDIAEDSVVRDMAFPSRERSLGWIKRGLISPGAQTSTFSPPPGTTEGSNPVRFRILARTLLLRIWVEQAGPFLVDQVPTGTFTPYSPGLIRRSERLRVFLRGARVGGLGRVMTATPVIPIGQNSVPFSTYISERVTVPEFYFSEGNVDPNLSAAGEHIRTFFSPATGPVQQGNLVVSPGPSGP